MTPSEAMDLLYHLGFCDRLQDCTCGLTEGIRRVEAAVRAQQAAEVERLERRVDELERDLAVFTKEPGVLARIGHEQVTYWYNQTRLRDAEVERLRAALFKYGAHLSGCSCRPTEWGALNRPCDCGLRSVIEAALAATPVAPTYTTQE